MKLQRQHILLRYLKNLSVDPVGVSNSRPPAWQPGAHTSEQPVPVDVINQTTQIVACVSKNARK